MYFLPGANINIKDGDSKPPLVYAVTGNAPNHVVEMLISWQTINCQQWDDNPEHTLLIHTTHHRMWNMAFLLVKHHADVNIQTQSGKTALSEAIKHDNAPIDLIRKLTSRSHIAFLIGHHFCRRSEKRSRTLYLCC